MRIGREYMNNCGPLVPLHFMSTVMAKSALATYLISCQVAPIIYRSLIRTGPSNFCKRLFIRHYVATNAPLDWECSRITMQSWLVCQFFNISGRSRRTSYSQRTLASSGPSAIALPMNLQTNHGSNFLKIMGFVANTIAGLPKLR